MNVISVEMLLEVKVMQGFTELEVEEAYHQILKPTKSKSTHELIGIMHCMLHH